MATISQPPVRPPGGGVPPRRSFLRAWWPAFVWIGIIGLESTDTFSSDNTGTWLYKLISHFYSGVNLYDVLMLNFYLRKTGHVIGYGMLSLLLLRGWRRTLARARATLGRETVGLVTYGRTAVLALLGTVFVASMDEWHQSYIPSRTGTWHDVVLDSTAGLIFLLLAFFWLKRRAVYQAT